MARLFLNNFLLLALGWTIYLVTTEYLPIRGVKVITGSLLAVA